jgi:hypothetical protein
MRTFRAWTIGLVTACLLTTHCQFPLDACTPVESQLGFFSKGDCILTRASFFQGHEWLSWFGNRDLPEDDRFTEGEIHTIAEGNRRVDWPKEMLIHMNNSIVAYVNALTEHTDRPENQRLHFLLTDTNDTPAAVNEATAVIANLTLEASQTWVSHRTRSLTLIGRANHTLQDSFSAAHTVREPGNSASPWCIRKVKAFIERKDGYDTDDIEYHGSSGDSVGHTTTQDSIYREGRDCHEPTSASTVEGCLSETAQRARLATRDYLALVRRVIASELTGNALEQLVENEIEQYSADHLELCP